MKALLQRLATSAIAPSRSASPQGDRIDMERARAHASSRFGYRREYQVEHRGEFSVRGGILDIFPPTLESGIRIDCFGDEVDRLTEFDIADQRSKSRDLERSRSRRVASSSPTDERHAPAALLAGEVDFAGEQFGRIADGELFDGMESFLPWLEADEVLVPDLLEAGDRVILVDPRRMRDRAVELVDEEAALAESLAVTWGVARTEEGRRAFRACISISTACSRAHRLERRDPAPGRRAARTPRRCAFVGLASRASVTPRRSRRRIAELADRACSVVVAADAAASAAPRRGARGRGPRRRPPTSMSSDASDERDALRSPGVHVVVAPIGQGFILGVRRSRSSPRRTSRGVAGRTECRERQRPVEGFFDDLAVGSFVVHHVHGVARYGGMVTRSIGGAERDYLLLEYRGGDKLYVPSDQIDTITPYSGGEHPALSRLNGSEWQRQRARVRQAVREIAQELVVLYQRRLAAPGHAFGPDTPWQAELEQAFPFPETPDQLKAIADVKADMERPVPMDRLVCGDVGFGKTEVAVRAVFKAVQDNKQAAVLVPTTLLAQQHFQTFTERYSPYPVRVEMLSRFLTNSEAKAVLAGLSTGAVDVVIGTHRLLGEDVRFFDLGLLVVDEEQRFGVSHKEAMKKLRVGVDVLTLTASPIPRTLEMGLTGIRDLSVIDTPPAERQPILTYVGEYDDRAVAESIRRELLREGQVFFVHNRVQDIERGCVSSCPRRVSPSRTGRWTRGVWRRS